MTWPRNKGVRISPERAAKIDELLADGYSAVRICCELEDVTLWQVKYRQRKAKAPMTGATVHESQSQ